MPHIFSISVCVIFASLGSVFGQGTTLAGSGYATPQIRLAPGEIITLFVSNTKGFGASQNATTIPLPKTLAGFSVSIRQSRADGGTFPAALLSVQPLLLCNAPDTGPNCQMTALTVQVPFEMVIGGDITGITDLIVNDNGTESVLALVAADEDHIHVLTTCETQASNSDRSSSVFPPCSGLVAHADGSLVSSKSPAQAGEVVVIYAFGLGPTSPTAKTGAVTPTPAPVLAYETLTLQFDFRPNAVPSRPYIDPLSAAPTAIFAGLTPGQVGLYQVNVRIPQSLPQIPACNSSSGGPFGYVWSNLTIEIGGVNSFDGAAICVQPSPQAQPAVNLARASHRSRDGG